MNILHFIVLAILAASMRASAAPSPSPLPEIDAPNICPTSKSSLSENSDAQSQSTSNHANKWQDLSRRARLAEDEGDFDLAIRFSIDSFCQVQNELSDTKTKIDSGSETIEHALDARQFNIAVEIYEKLEALQTAEQSRRNVPNFKFEMAHARLLAFQDKPKEALQIREAIAPLIAHDLGISSSEYVLNRIRASDLKIELGRVDEALATLQSVHSNLHAQHVVGSNLDYLAVRAIGVADALLGHENDALNILQELRTEIALGRRSDNPKLMALDENICDVLIRLEHMDDALAIASRIFLVRARGAVTEQSSYFQALWRLAYLYIENARHASAKAILDYLDLNIDSQSATTSDDFRFQVIGLRAGFSMANGDFKGAEKSWRKVHDFYLANFGADSVDTQIALANLAIALGYVGKPIEACDMLKNVENQIANTRPEDTWTFEFAHLAYLDCEIENSNGVVAKSKLIEMERAWRALEDHIGSTSKDSLDALGGFAIANLKLDRRESGKELLREYVSLIERERHSASEEGSVIRIATLSSWIADRSYPNRPANLYRRLSTIYAQDSESARALKISELARDRSLGDLFAEQEWRRTFLPTGARRRLDPVLDGIQDLDERIAASTDVVERVTRESERTLLVAERARLEQELRVQLRIPGPSGVPPTLDELRDGLASGTALVSVVHSGETWWALVIAHEEPVRFVEFAEPDLGRLAAAWVRRVRGDPVRLWEVGDRLVEADVRPAGAAGPFLSTEALAQRLGRSLVDPVAAAAGHARRLVFIGDDELVGVPLQALPLGNGLVLDRFDVSYAPSVSTYSRLQAKPRRASSSWELFALGAVDFPRVDRTDDDDPVAVGLEYAADHPLPYVREELDAIAGQFPAGTAQVHVGTGAGKEELRAASRSGELARYRFVHFATHAWAQTEEPERSAIFLAGGRDSVAAHHALTAVELAGLRMDAEMFVLSACDTGSGRFEHGRGLLGLAYAALAAGNRSALLSLWPIADDTTARFMASLYRRLRVGASPAAALAATQREFRASPDPRLSDPSAWAPFVLYGGE